MCKCLAIGEVVPCSARKYVAYVSQTEAHVYHIGDHTCIASLPDEAPTEHVKEALRNNPRVTPSTIQSAAILSAIRSRVDPTELRKVVSSVGSKKKISNEKIKQKKIMYPDGCSFDAVKSLKAYFDDPYYIFKVDEDAQMVFKTSKLKMEMAAKVSSKTSLLSNEYCSFDGKVNRTKNFTTLTSSIYHPFLQKQVPLATMECISEDTKNVELYWKTFNDAYKAANNTTGKLYFIMITMITLNLELVN